MSVILFHIISEIKREVDCLHKLLSNNSGTTFSGAGDYNYSTASPEYSPDFGQVRFDNADPTLATMGYINSVDAVPSPIDITTWLLNLGVGTSSKKSILYFHKENSPYEFVAFEISSAFNNGGVIVMPLTYYAGNITMSAEDKYIVSCTKVGDKGEAGTPGSAGSIGGGGFPYRHQGGEGPVGVAQFRITGGGNPQLIIFHNVYYDGSDLSGYFATFEIGSRILVQGITNAQYWALYELTTVPDTSGSVTLFIVNLLTSSGEEPEEQDMYAISFK